LIEPLGARTNLTKLTFTLRCLKPPTKAGRTGQPELAEQLQQLTKQPLIFNLLRCLPSRILSGLAGRSVFDFRCHGGRYHTKFL